MAASDVVVTRCSFLFPILHRARRSNVDSGNSTSASRNSTQGVVAGLAPAFRPTEGKPPSITSTASRSRKLSATSTVPSVDPASATITRIAAIPS